MCHDIQEEKFRQMFSILPIQRKLEEFQEAGATENAVVLSGQLYVLLQRLFWKEREGEKMRIGEDENNEHRLTNIEL